MVSEKYIASTKGIIRKISSRAKAGRTKAQERYCSLRFQRDPLGVAFVFVLARSCRLIDFLAYIYWAESI